MIIIMNVLFICCMLYYKLEVIIKYFLFVTSLDSQVGRIVSSCNSEFEGGRIQNSSSFGFSFLIPVCAFVLSFFLFLFPPFEILTTSKPEIKSSTWSSGFPRDSFWLKTRGLPVLASEFWTDIEGSGSKYWKAKSFKAELNGLGKVGTW